MNTPKPAIDPNDIFNHGKSFDPHPMMAASRKATPVLQLTADALGMFPGAAEMNFMSLLEGGASAWVCFRRAEVMQVLRDTQSFNSDALKAFGGGNGDPSRPSLPSTEGAAHRRLRGLVGHAFRPAAIARWKSEFIEPLAHRLIDAFHQDGWVELNEQFAMELPVQVISRMIGFPATDYEQFRDWTFDILLSGLDPERGRRARSGLSEYIQRALCQARQTPGDDLISDLVVAKEGGDQLSDDEIIGAVVQIVIAGNETTFRQIGTMMYALLTHREEFEKVRANTELVPQVIEESLRWEPPLPFDARTAIVDTTLAGQRIRAGDLVIVSIVSANRDEDFYEQPDRFWIERPNSSHLSFATGPHICLGAHLARLELQICLTALLQRLPNMRLDEVFEPRPEIRGTVVRGPSRLPIRFDIPKAG